MGLRVVHINNNRMELVHIFCSTKRSLKPSHTLNLMARKHIQVFSVLKNHFIEALLVLSESDKNDKRSDGLPSSIVSALSLATSGMGLTHSDIGGYTGLKTFGLNMNTMHWDEKSFIQLPILCVNSQAVGFLVLWGRRSYFCVGQSTLYFPQSWELMRFVSLLHEDTSDSHFR